MYRSARARKAQRRRIQKIVIGGVAALGLLIAAVAIAESGGGGHKASGCLILDVSKSTAEARSRYPEEFRQFATTIAAEGSGDICLILAAADPVAEGTPIYSSVAPDPDNAGKPKGVAEIKAKIEQATTDVEAMMEQPGVMQGGSGLVEAAAVAAEHLESGDELLFLSDGLQWSKAGGHLMTTDLTPATIARILRELDEGELLPDLHGVKVHFPLMLYHPEGFHGHVIAARKVKPFWEAWGRATGAELTIGRLE
jgi:hypothetical protein